MSDRYSREELIRRPLHRDVGEAIRKAIEDYTDYQVIRNHAPKGIDVGRGHLEEFGLWLHENGIDDPRDVSRQLLTSYQAWMHAHRLRHGGTRAFSTQSQRLTSLRMFFRYLKWSERMAENPALYLELPREEQPLPKAALTREEVERVLAQPDVKTVNGIRERAIMETLFATGIRRNELVHLTLADVDQARRTLTVRRGKGKRGRMVPISDRALAWIARYLSVRPKPADEGQAQCLFLTMRGYMLGSVTLSRNIRLYVEGAGIGKTGGCHIFRATTATLMLEAGVEMRFIQEMLGHAKITTTQRYTRISVAALHQVYAQNHPSARDREPIPPLAYTPPRPGTERPAYYRWNSVKSPA